MNKFYFFIIAMLVSVASRSQVTRTWIGPATGGNWQTAANWSGNAFPTTGNIAEINTGSSNTVITNIPADLQLGGLIITGNSVVTISNNSARNFSIANDITAENGNDFVINTGSNLIIGNNINCTLNANATAFITGRFDINNSRNYTSNGTTTVAVTGVMNNMGTVSTFASNRLVFLSAATYIHFQNGGTIPAATFNSGSNCFITGIVNAASVNGLNQVFGNLVWDNPLQNSGSQLSGGSFTIADTLTVANTGTATLQLVQGSGNTVTARCYKQTGGNVIIGSDGANNVTKTFTVTKSFVVSGGTFNMDNGNATGGTFSLLVGGNFSISGNSTAFTRTSTTNNIANVNYNGAATQTFSKTGGTISGNINFTINTGAAVDFGSSVLNGSTGIFTLSDGARLMTAHANGLQSTGAGGAIQLPVRRYRSGADYEFRGNETGLFITTPLANTVRKLIINNTNGNVTLSDNRNVTDSLILNSGILITNEATAMLTIKAGGGAKNYSSLSFISGPMQKEGNTEFEFPTGWIGTGGGMVPIKMAELSAVSTMRVKYNRAPGTSVAGTINAPLQHVSYCEYWELYPVTGAVNAVITMYWNEHSNCNPVSYINDFDALRIARSSGGSWGSFGNTGGSLVHRYVVSNTPITNISATNRYFTLASTSNASNPLPVLFDNVAAYKKGEGVQIEWSNLTERDLAIYYIERSVNGRDYSIIGKYFPKYNNNDVAHYSYYDDEPATGDNYYRIKVIEQSGKIIFSKILKVDMSQVKRGFTLYPNPVTGKQFTVSLSGIKVGQYQVRIINATGQDVFQKTITSQGDYMTQTISLPATVTTGVYTMLISGNAYKETTLFIVQ